MLTAGGDVTFVKFCYRSTSWRSAWNLFWFVCCRDSDAFPVVWTTHIKSGASCFLRSSCSTLKPGGICCRTYSLTKLGNGHLLTYSMEQSPSWEANLFASSQEIPCILWKLKVHYCIHKCPPPVPILSQLNPGHTPHPTSWRPILILSSHLHLGLPSGFFLQVSPPKPCPCLSPPPYMLHSLPISFFSIL